MKGFITKVTAVLLIIWYSMSIIGFGVHTCSGSGKSFVVSFVEGLSCEDIHPEHHCSKGACCSHTHSCCDKDNGLSVKPRSCCSSDYQVLALTGTVSDEKNSNADTPLYCNCFCPEIFGQDIYFQNRVPHIHLTGFSPGQMPDIQSVLGVWRI